MPFSNKLVIAFTVFILLVGPYLTYKMVEAGMSTDVSLAQTLTDKSTTSVDREVAQIKQRHLTGIVIGQIAMLVVAQVAMVGLSVMLIREHKRSRRLKHSG